MARIPGRGAPRPYDRGPAPCSTGHRWGPRLGDVWGRPLGILNAEDHPEWATSAMVVEWVRALRAEETDPGPDPIPVGTVPKEYSQWRTVQRRVADADPTDGAWAPNRSKTSDDADPG